MTTAVLDAPAPVDDETPPAAQTPDARGPGLPARLLSQLGPYAGYVGYFVGAGLISGGIVHYPLEPGRYFTIAAAGVVVFLLATLFNEVVLAVEKPARGRLLRVVGGSLLLSLGIGMLSGGIQHFSDFPARAAGLIPAGLALSFLAYNVRNADSIRKAVVSAGGAAVLVLAVGLYFGLQTLVGEAPAAAHSHGAAEPAAAAADGHGAAAATADGHGAAPAAADDHGTAAVAANGHGAADPALGAAQDAHAPAPVQAPSTEELTRLVEQLKASVDDLKAASE